MYIQPVLVDLYKKYSELSIPIDIFHWIARPKGCSVMCIHTCDQLLQLINNLHTYTLDDQYLNIVVREGGTPQRLWKICTYIFIACFCKTTTELFTRLKSVGIRGLPRTKNMEEEDLFVVNVYDMKSLNRRFFRERVIENKKCLCKKVFTKVFPEDHLGFLYYAWIDYVLYHLDLEFEEY